MHGVWPAAWNVSLNRIAVSGGGHINGSHARSALRQYELLPQGLFTLEHCTGGVSNCQSLSGALAAAALSRAGVAVVDRHSTYPADFHAEHLVGSQTDTMRRLGLLDGIAGQATPVPPTYRSGFGNYYIPQLNAIERLSPIEASALAPLPEPCTT